MSDATEDDYRGYLAQQLAELRIEATNRQEAMIAKLAAKGLGQSGAGIRMGVAELDELLSGYVGTLSDSLPQWSGANLSEQSAREILVRHLRETFAELIIRRYAYRLYADSDESSIICAFEGLLERLREKLFSRARIIELGVKTKPAVQSITTNTVTADNILGPVLQGGPNRRRLPQSRLTRLPSLRRWAS